MYTDLEKQIADVIRYCADIGLWAIDRPVSSCCFASSFCATNCYNRKLYLGCYGSNMKAKDRRNESAWLAMRSNPEAAAKAMKTVLMAKREKVKRFRFMTRGEALETREDIALIKSICEAMPKILFWLPTRSWRNAEMRRLVERELLPLSNLRIMASLDPTTQKGPDSWSTMFFGDDDATSGRVLCSKTHKGIHGACATCRKGCFSSARVDVHMKQH